MEKLYFSFFKRSLPLSTLNIFSLFLLGIIYLSFTRQPSPGNNSFAVLNGPFALVLPVKTDILQYDSKFKIVANKIHALTAFGFKSSSNFSSNSGFDVQETGILRPRKRLSFSPNTLNYTVQQNGSTANKSTVLSSNSGSTSVSLTKSANSNWLILPSATLGSLSFGINATGLSPGTYTSIVTASALFYNSATLQVTLTVTSPPALSFSPTALSFSVVQNGGTANKSSTLSRNTGTPVVSLSKSANSNWLVLPSAAFGSLSFGINSAGLTPGNYTSTVTASASGYTSATLEVTLTVTAAQVLSFSPTSLSFSVLQNSTVSNQSSTLSANSGTPSVSLTKSANSNWLVLPSPALGSLAFGINSAGLNPGNYTSTVTASASGYTSATLQITLTVTVAQGLSFSPTSLSFSVVQNGAASNQSATLSSNSGAPSVSLTKSANSSWLALPSPALGSLSFGINSAGLIPGTYTSTVTASANGYSDATLSISLTVSSSDKSITFTQSSQSAEVEQGSSQSLLDYIATTDNIPVNAHLTAVDGSNNTPAWLTVNGNLLNGINYTTGSEITFDFDATNLSVGSYPAVITASASGYNDAVLDILLTVKSPSGGTLTTLKVNFQDSLTVPPTGWLRDFGQSFGPRTSANQGTGNSYGWVKRSDRTPLDLTKNGRDRNSPSDVLLATFMHMQGDDIVNFTGTPIEGIWEAQVTNGNYDVTVSVGDDTNIDSKHSINVEGVSAISAFVPTAAIKFKSATITVSVADGFLTIDAISGTNTKINYVNIQPSTSIRPSVIAVNPENSSQNVSENASVSTSILNLPNGGINNSTITTSTVYLTEEATGVIVASNVNGTGGGDAITLVPSVSLKLGTTYNFNVTSGVKDVSGASFIPYASRFTTGSGSTSETLNARFDRIDLPNATGRHSSLTMGPDGKLYALSIDGIIKRFAINSDGTLATPEILYSLQDAYGTRTPRLAIGFAFDPSSTPSNLIAWVTHSSYLFLNGPDWDGKLSKLSGNNLQTVQDVLINLPRSARDHVTNSVAFGPDGALYFTQGSTSAMGNADLTWGNRSEHLLSATVLRLDLSKLGALPLNVKTPEGGGTYNPYAANVPLTIYASGVRNAYDLVWHSNGNLYVPTNGSAAGGNTPASVNGTLRPDGSTYNGPVIPALNDVQQTMPDFLFRVVQGGYYGHPNPTRGEYVMNGGNPTSFIDPGQVNEYPVGTQPDANWRGYSFDFQNNKSPDGAIEYKSNTFNGALKGKLLVVRYSQHDDIITLTPGGTNNDIISSVEGTSIEGFSGFIDPLDLTEDVNTGNIYVSEYGGDGKIILLRVNESVDTSGEVIVSPFADAFVRKGTYADINYGTDTALIVKTSSSVSLNRLSYLKFSLNNISKITTAKLRVYGRNTEDAVSVKASAFGVNTDSWTENGITFNNAPAASTSALSTVGVNDQAKYYEFDVTSYVKTQFAGDKMVTLLIKDTVSANKNLSFNSRENGQNPPELVIDTTSAAGAPLANTQHSFRTSDVTKIAIVPVTPQHRAGVYSMQQTNESENNFELPKIYPNPVQNRLTIEFPSKYQGNFEVQIVDLVGRTYEIAKISLKAGGSSMKTDLSRLNLKKGVYFLRVSADSIKPYIKKLIIQ